MVHWIFRQSKLTPGFVLLKVVLVRRHVPRTGEPSILDSLGYYELHNTVHPYNKP